MTAANQQLAQALLAEYEACELLEKELEALSAICDGLAEVRDALLALRQQ